MLSINSISEKQISVPNLSHQMSMNANSKAYFMLSSGLYKNPHESIIRELVSNVIDACRAANTEEPVIVHIPDNQLEDLFIQDFGIGMDLLTVHNVFGVYFNSTKDNNSQQIGGFGIGGKTPFLYTEQFTMETTSPEDGIRRTFIFSISNWQPSFIHKQELDIENSKVKGTKISFKIKSNDDIPRFLSALNQILFSTHPITLQHGSLTLDDVYKNIGLTNYHDIMNDVKLCGLAIFEKNSLPLKGMCFNGSKVNRLSINLICGDICYPYCLDFSDLFSIGNIDAEELFRLYDSVNLYYCFTNLYQSLINKRVPDPVDDVWLVHSPENGMIELTVSREGIRETESNQRYIVSLLTKNLINYNNKFASAILSHLEHLKIQDNALYQDNLLSEYSLYKIFYNALPTPPSDEEKLTIKYFLNRRLELVKNDHYNILHDNTYYDDLVTSYVTDKNILFIDAVREKLGRYLDEMNKFLSKYQLIHPVMTNSRFYLNDKLSALFMTLVKQRSQNVSLNKVVSAQNLSKKTFEELISIEATPILLSDFIETFINAITYKNHVVFRTFLYDHRFWGASSCIHSIKILTNFFAFLLFNSNQEDIVFSDLRKVMGSLKEKFNLAGKDDFYSNAVLNKRVFYVLLKPVMAVNDHSAFHTAYDFGELLQKCQTPLSTISNKSGDKKESLPKNNRTYVLSNELKTLCCYVHSQDKLNNFLKDYPDGIVIPDKITDEFLSNLPYLEQLIFRSLCKGKVPDKVSVFKDYHSIFNQITKYTRICQFRSEEYYRLYNTEAIPNITVQLKNVLSYVLRKDMSCLNYFFNLDNKDISPFEQLSRVSYLNKYVGIYGLMGLVYNHLSKYASSLLHDKYEQFVDYFISYFFNNFFINNEDYYKDMDRFNHARQRLVQEQLFKELLNPYIEMIDKNDSNQIPEITTIWQTLSLFDDVKVLQSVCFWLKILSLRDSEQNKIDQIDQLISSSKLSNHSEMTKQVSSFVNIINEMVSKSIDLIDTLNYDVARVTYINHDTENNGQTNSPANISIFLLILNKFIQETYLC